MSKARHQSLGRAIRRGRAVVSKDNVTGGLYHTYRKGSTRKQWRLAQQCGVSVDPQREKRDFRPRHIWNPRNKTAIRIN